MWKPFRPLEGHWGKEGLALFRGVSVGEKEISHLQVDRFLCNMRTSFLEWRSSRTSVHETHFESSLEHMFMGPHPEILIQ